MRTTRARMMTFRLMFVSQVIEDYRDLRLSASLNSIASLGDANRKGKEENQRGIIKANHRSV